MGEIGFITAGMLSSCAFVYTSPAALPEKSLMKTTEGAFMTSLCLVSTFLLTDAVWITADALWGVSASLILCAFFSFVFSSAALWIIMPGTSTFSIAPSALVLVLTQPQTASVSESIMYAIGTAAGIILLLSALSPILRRAAFSDAPRCLKGIPSLLLVLGICALAFGGF